MCGIVGYVGRSAGLSQPKLIRMRDTLSHRGPDGKGLVAWNATGRMCAEGEPLQVGLAHRRLSIIDLTEAGAQPMSNEDGSMWITYNGEFYNFQEYRKELEDKGHVFRSHCDTETILHLYEEYGLDKTLACINGMFAFGLWDARKKELILARDRAGKKPLYYAHLPDGTLLFASEIKALLASGLVDREQWDETALDQIWSFGYSAGQHTLYRQIRKLLPGHTLIWRAGQIAVRRYWQLQFGSAAESARPLSDWADELEVLLTDAIRLRLVADVPVGLFLSGGIDSSLIAALAARITNQQVRTYTIGFSRADYDESHHAVAIANELGVRNEVLFAEDDVLASANAVARQFDEPFGDSSALPTWLVAKLASQHVIVALTGDGGDELFAGYESFRQALRIWGGRDVRQRFERPLTRSEWLWTWKLRILGFDRGYPLLEQETGWRMRRRLFTHAFRRRNPYRAAYADRDELLRGSKGRDMLSRMQDVVFSTWLPDDFLRKVDTASMAHSLECRCPLLDHRIMSFAARLPFDALFDEGGRGKRIMREVLSRFVPRELFQRPKQGFSIPWEDWCAGAAASRYAQLWREERPAAFRGESVSDVFPDTPGGSRFLRWLAFCTLQGDRLCPSGPAGDSAVEKGCAEC